MWGSYMEELFEKVSSAKHVGIHFENRKLEDLWWT